MRRRSIGFGRWRVRSVANQELFRFESGWYANVGEVARFVICAASSKKCCASS
jgi:hypothetical protein